MTYLLQILIYPQKREKIAEPTMKRDTTVQIHEQT